MPAGLPSDPCEPGNLPPPTSPYNHRPTGRWILLLAWGQPYAAVRQEPRAADHEAGRGTPRRRARLHGGAWAAVRSGLPALGLRILRRDAQGSDAALRRAAHDPP